MKIPSPFQPLAFRTCMRFGAAIEPWLLSRPMPEAGPIFITGLPRSGTTLAYQCIVHAFNFSYLTNLAARFNECPVVASYVSRLLGLRYTGDFTSHYGMTSQSGGLSEGWTIMNRWFCSGSEEKGDYLDINDLKDEARQQIRGTIGGVMRAFGRPFVNKNVKHGVRIRALLELFPSCVFIVMQRNRLSVAQSILQGRIDQSGDKNTWFSVKPSAWASFADEPYIDQICKQIYFWEKDVERDSHVVGRKRFLFLDYESLCREPRKIMSTVNRFLSKHDITVDRRSDLPEMFPISNKRKVSKDDYEALHSGLKHLYGNRELMGTHSEAMHG